MRWTGFGWMLPVLVIVFFFVGAGVGVILTRGDNIPAGILVGAGLMMVLLAPLHLLLGLALNSERTPSGRRWHNRHTYFNAPMQYGFGAQLVLALIIGAVALGQLTSPLYGWLLFGGIPVVGLVGYGLLDKKRHLGPVSGWATLYVLLALVIGSIVLGQTFGSLYGWLLFGGVLVALMGCIIIFSQLKRCRGANATGNAAGSIRTRIVDSNPIRRPPTR
jgi:hypothetical protein